MEILHTLQASHHLITQKNLLTQKKSFSTSPTFTNQTNIDCDWYEGFPITLGHSPMMDDA